MIDSFQVLKLTKTNDSPWKWSIILRNKQKRNSTLSGFAGKEMAELSKLPLKGTLGGAAEMHTCGFSTQERFCSEYLKEDLEWSSNTLPTVLEVHSSHFNTLLKYSVCELLLINQQYKEQHKRKKKRSCPYEFVMNEWWCAFLPQTSKHLSAVVWNAVSDVLFSLVCKSVWGICVGVYLFSTEDS